MRQEKTTRRHTPHIANQQESKRREQVFNCSAVINGSVSRDRCNAAGIKSDQTLYVIQLLQPQQTEYKHNNIEAVIDRYWMDCVRFFVALAWYSMVCMPMVHIAHRSTVHWQVWKNSDSKATKSLLLLSHKCVCDCTLSPLSHSIFFFRLLSLCALQYSIEPILTNKVNAQS